MPNGYAYTWTGKSSSNFGTAGNWYNQSTGTTATAVPGINDQAVITSAGSITGSGNVYNLGLVGSGAGTLTIAATLSGTNLFTANNVAVSSGASLVFSNLIQIGDYNNTVIGHTPSTVTINAGGLIRDTLQTTYYYGFYVGVSGGTGTLTVTGQGALADAGARGFDVGNAGTGTINVGAGAHVTGGTGNAYQNGVSEQLGLTLGEPGGNGSLNVSGAGAGATFGDIVEVGYGGTGAITVQNGGTLTAGDGAFSLDIGETQNNSTGSGSVNFIGGSGTLNGLVEVGTAGAGSLGLSAGASLTINATSYASSTAYWSAIVGVSSGVSGTITIGSQSVLTTNYGLAIGVGGHGELDINGGQALLSSPTGGADVSFDVALQAGSSGVVNLTAGLLQDVSSTGMVIGDAGSGTMTVSAGGTLIAGGANGFGGLFIGSKSGSTGSLTVTGAGTSLTETGELQVGAAGTGTLLFSAGAHATLASPSPNNEPGLAIGSNGGTGHLTIDGAGTVMTETGQLMVGGFGAGRGTMTVSGGATLSVLNGSGQTLPGAIIGLGNGTPASLATITGAGSDWSIQGGLFVGETSHGTLSVQAGAHVSAAYVTIGGGSGGTGDIIVAGKGSVLSTGILQIGTSDATAKMTVSQGTVTASSSIDVAGNVLIANAGTLAATGDLAIENGAIIHGRGTIQGADIIDAGRITCDGGVMKCIGAVGGNGVLRVQNGGNLTLASTVNDTVHIQFAAGSTITAGTVADIAGTISGWTTGDVLHFTANKIASETYSQHHLNLYDAQKNLLGSLTFAGSYTAANFILTKDVGGTLLTYHG